MLDAMPSTPNRALADAVVAGRALIATVANLSRRRPGTDHRDDLVDQYSAALGIDAMLASEVAQFHTFAIPRISALLHRTGEYENDGVRRLGDTAGLMSPALSSGAHSPEGAEAIAQINRIHGEYSIRNDDFLYVLSTFAFGSEYWSQRYAWRTATPEEEAALYPRLVEVGRAMGIAEVPDDIEEFRRWVQGYLAEHRRFHPDNYAVAEGMMRAIEEMVPVPLRPLISPITRVWIGDPELLDALGYELPHPAFARVVNAAMTVRKEFHRRFTAMNGRTFTDLYLATAVSYTHLRDH